MRKELALTAITLGICALTYAQESRKLSIENIFEIAERHSKSIKIFDIAEREAEQNIKIAKTALLPSLNASLSISYLGNAWISDRDFSNGESAYIPHLGNNFALSASQVVYAGGAIKNGIEAAKLQHQIAQLDTEKNRQDIRFLLVGYYLELYKLKNESDVYKSNIEQTKRLLIDINARQVEGLALKNDITRYELQLKSLILALTQTENSITIINNQLTTVLGLSANTKIEIDDKIANYVPSISSESEWQQQAIATSPDMERAKLGISLSKRNEKIVNAERLPNIALFAGDNFDGPITIEVPPIDKNLNYWFVGVKVNYNIASLYKTNKKNKLARLSTLRAEESHQLMKDNISIAVNEAYVRYVESYTIYDTKIKSLELANQNYSIINNRYLNDLALITDMLDASNSKLNAELQVANSKINIIYNYYKLKKVSGNI